MTERTDFHSKMKLLGFSDEVNTFNKKPIKLEESIFKKMVKKS